MKTRPARKRTEEYVSYLLRVLSWDFYFWRHATDPKSKWETWPVGELTTLSFAGEVIRPEKSRYKSGKLTFSGGIESPKDEERGRQPVPIGSVTARNDEIDAYVFVSEERLGLLLTAAQSGRIQIAHFAGPKLRYGSSKILSVSLHTHFDEDEW